jgi:enoyl-CoA hydratase
MPACIKVERRNSIAIIIFDRQNVLNVVNHQMRSELISILAQSNHDPAVRALVITGAGDRAFCAGQDLNEASQLDAAKIESWMAHQCAMFQALRDVDKPTIVAFNGVAAGTGFQIGLLADLRVGYPEMQIGQPEVRVGLASIIGSYLMTLHLGLAHNSQLSITGELVSGGRAYEMGILNYLVPRSEVLSEAVRVASDISNLPTTAVRLTKQRFREMTQRGFEEACQAGLRAHLEDYRSGEPQQAMQQFLAARAARKDARK